MTSDKKWKRPPLLVVGIGNILLRDEGVGVHVVNILQKMELPDFAEVLDGGTAGADLLDPLCDRQKVVFIDAVDAECEPGTILRLKPEDLAKDMNRGISLHEFGLAETLAMARRLGCAPREVLILGVKPEDISPGLEMTKTIGERVGEIVRLVVKEIEAFPEEMRG